MATMKEIAARCGAVSYTHLDVYKRQHQHRLSKRADSA